MDETALVQKAERLQNVEGDRDGLFDARPLTAEPRIQPLALEELHRDPQLVLPLLHSVDLTDPGMVEAGRGTRLSPQAVPQLLRLELSERLERDLAAEAFVRGTIDHTHAAPAKHFRDQVWTDPFGRAGSVS